MKTKLILTSIPLAVALAGQAVAAPVAVSAPTTYTQNFDAMFSPATAGSVASGVAGAATNWADDSTIPGWWVHYSGATAGPGTLAGASFVYNGNDGSAVPATTLNSAGAVNSADRAMAFVGTTNRGEQSGIVIFQNTGTTYLGITQIQYKGEEFVITTVQISRNP